MKILITAALLIGLVGAAAPANDAPGASNWPTYGLSYANTRYSSLTQITSQNVKNLAPAWQYRTRAIGPLEGSPIVVDGTMYATAQNDIVVALNPASGAVKWRFVPKLGFASFCCGAVNRGVAVDGGKVFLGTLDGRLIALNAQTGKKVWQVTVGDAHDAFSETIAPLTWNGTVYIGSSGGEYGIRGSLTAYAERDGKMLWRWYSTSKGWEGNYVTSVNGHSLHRDIAKEKAQDAQYADAWKHGGGPIWTTPSLDPARGTIYFGTGNPSPQLIGSHRPGDNLYTDSIVALDAKTGRMKWYYQETPHDIWDYDATSPTVLADVYDQNGNVVPAVMQAGKTGWIYEINRDTGKLIRISDSVAPQLNLFEPPGPNGEIVEPGALGGVNWSPASYNATDRLEYVAAMVEPRFDKPLEYEPWQPNAERWAGSREQVPKGEDPTGTLTAVNLDSGKIAWQQKTPSALLGGTAAAADLVFTGQSDGMFDAYDAATGKLLWQYQTAAGVDAPPVVYEVKGREYVTVESGGDFELDNTYGDTIITFALPKATANRADRIIPKGGGGDVSSATGSMRIDRGNRSVAFAVEMGAAGEASGLNFDGKAHGHLTITVPLNWTVAITAKNDDSLPHSLEIVPAQSTPPLQGIDPPAFAGAQTTKLLNGMPEDQSDTFRFTANKSGRYWMMCGVPGHAAGGMWDWFIVSNSAQSPSIK